MKKATSFLKFLLVALLSAALVIGASKLIEPMKYDGGTSQFASIYPSGKNFEEIDSDNTETINAVYEVRDDSNTLGYVFDATVPKGYSGPINFLIGISKDGIIQGFEVIDHSETQGFGAAIETQEFLEGIKDVNVSNGVNAGSKDVESGTIEAISGATITTNALRDELKVVVDLLSKFSDSVAPIVEEKPYYAEYYKDLLPLDLKEYKFEELKTETDSEVVYNKSLNRIIRVKYANGDFNSYILQVSAQGYGGPIDTLVRVNDQYRVFDIVYPLHNETEGFGAYIEDEVYKNSIRGLNLDKNFLTKAIKLRDNPTGEKDILLISGATVTSQAMQLALDNTIEGLVAFDRVKGIDEKFIEINLDEIMPKPNNETKSKYDHSLFFDKVDESKLLDKGSNEEVVYVSQAISNGQVIGKIFDINVEGFAGKIEYALLVSEEGVIEDYIIYNHSETEGYGKVIEEDSFKSKIIGIDLSSITNFSADTNFDSLSGATYTQDALVKGFNSVIKAYTDSKDAKVVEAQSDSSTSRDYSIFNGIDDTMVVEGHTDEIVTNVLTALASGQQKGHIFDVKVEGYAGPIEFGILISPDNTVEDFVVYSHEETPGFGAEIEEESYKNAMIGKKISEIDSISGATITSEAMKKAFDHVMNKASGLGQ